MDATINQNTENQSFPMENDTAKSELMQFFERQVTDIYWAHKDLLKAIFDSQEDPS